jgi:hypothetical protein
MLPQSDTAEESTKLERALFAHVIGTLLAWLIGLLIYLMYRLWQDYISTILMSIIVSQSLHAARARIVGLLQWLRSPASPPLLHTILHSVSQPWKLLTSLAEVPPLLQLAALLLLLLVQNVYTWAYVGLALLGPFVALLAAVALLDKQLLRTDALLSDEVLAALIVVSTLLTVLSFVGTTLAVQSVLDGVQILVASSSYMASFSSEAAEPIKALAAQGVQVSAQRLKLWTRKHRSCAGAAIEPSRGRELVV